MKVRRVTREDYEALKGWWSAQKWEAPPLECLPTVGFMIEDVCAGFLYQTDSAFSWLEFVIANPDTDKKVRSEALDLVINALTKASKELGYKAIYTTLNHPKLIERYQKHGFMKTDEGITALVRSI